MAGKWILRKAMNLYHMNRKSSIGATSYNIRKCLPNTKQDWKEYYYINVHSEKEIEEIGNKLYSKIKKKMMPQIMSITKQECVDFMKYFIFEDTYKGHRTEVQVIKKLKNEINNQIDPASDELDRKYNIDFTITINRKLIGIQVKPHPKYERLHDIQQPLKIERDNHQKFEQKFGGKVFYLYAKENENSEIVISNPEVIDEIKQEIQRLEKMK